VAKITDAPLIGRTGPQTSTHKGTLITITFAQPPHPATLENIDEANLTAPTPGSKPMHCFHEKPPSP
jgi:hypothetical protein